MQPIRGVLDVIHTWLTCPEVVHETINISPVSGDTRLVPSYVLQDINTLQMEFEIKPDPDGNENGTQVGYWHRFSGALWLMSVSDRGLTFRQLGIDTIAETYSYQPNQVPSRARLCINPITNHVILEVLYTQWCSIVVNLLPISNFNVTDTFPVIRGGTQASGKMTPITFITTTR